MKEIIFWFFIEKNCIIYFLRNDKNNKIRDRSRNLASELL